MGIDYGSITGVNRNKQTGIHYGVIAQWSLDPDVINDVIMEGVYYGEPTCPKCGNDAQDYDRQDIDGDWERGFGCHDYMCQPCRYVFDTGEAFAEEMLGWTYDSDGYELQDCLDTDVMVIESPYYTYAEYCSPCVPGACNLDQALTDLDYDIATDHGMTAPKTYCLGHDWFEGNKAPYRVFRVSDGSEVLPEGKE